MLHKPDPSNVDTPLYSDVSTFLRYITFISFNIMWIHVYIVMYPNLEDTLIDYALPKIKRGFMSI